MTDPAALLTRLEEAKQSRDVWQIALAEQALEHAAPELAAEAIRLRELLTKAEYKQCASCRHRDRFGFRAGLEEKT